MASISYNNRFPNDWLISQNGAVLVVGSEQDMTTPGDGLFARFNFLVAGERGFFYEGNPSLLEGKFMLVFRMRMINLGSSESTERLPYAKISSGPLGSSNFNVGLTTSGKLNAEPPLFSDEPVLNEWINMWAEVDYPPAGQLFNRIEIGLTNAQAGDLMDIDNVQLYTRFDLPNGFDGGWSFGYDHREQKITSDAGLPFGIKHSPLRVITVPLTVQDEDDVIVDLLKIIKQVGTTEPIFIIPRETGTLANEIAVLGTIQTPISISQRDATYFDASQQIVVKEIP